MSKNGFLEAKRGCTRLQRHRCFVFSRFGGLCHGNEIDAICQQVGSRKNVAFQNFVSEFFWFCSEGPRVQVTQVPSDSTTNPESGMSSRNEFWRSIILFGLCTPFGQLCKILCLAWVWGRVGVEAGNAVKGCWNYTEDDVYAHIYIYSMLICICTEFCVNTCMLYDNISTHIS